MLAEDEAPDTCPSSDLITRLSLSSTGSLWERFPRFVSNMKNSDSLPPVPADFVSFVGRVPPFAPCSLPRVGALLPGTGVLLSG